MNRKDSVATGIGLMMLFCLLAPLIDVSSKLAAQQISPGTVTLWRYIWQGILMLPVVLFLGLPMAMSRQAWALTFLRGFVSVIATFCFIAAIREMPIADALAIAFVEPFVILLIGHFFMAETVGPRRLGAAVVGFVGALFVIKPSFSVFGPVALLPLGTAVSFAAYILVTRRLSTLVHPVTMQLHTALTGTLVCLPILLIGEGADITSVSFDWPHGIFWLWLFGVGFFASLSHLAMTYAFSFAPASTLAPLHYFEIISATILGYLVFGDFPDALSWVGIAIIVASGLYLIHRERVTAANTRAS